MRCTKCGIRVALFASGLCVRCMDPDPNIAIDEASDDEAVEASNFISKILGYVVLIAMLIGLGLLALVVWHKMNWLL